MILNLDEVFTAQLIAEDIESVDKETDDKTVILKMRQNSFDILPISFNNVIQEYYNKEDILNESMVKPRQIQISQILSKEATLLQVLSLLAEQSFLFLIEGNSINKIITTADLVKQTFRIYVFGIVSNFEIALTSYIREKNKITDVTKFTTRTALEKAKELYNDRIQLNVDTDLIDCFNLTAKINILLKIDNEKYSKKDKKYLYNAKNLRNDVTHGLDYLKQTDLKSFYNMLEYIKDLTVRLQTWEHSINCES